MRQKIEKPNIVEEYKIGNTTILIADNCCRDKTHEDGETAMEQIVQIALRAWAAADMQEEKAEVTM